MISEQKLDSVPIKQAISRLKKTLKELRECENKEELFRRLFEDVEVGLCEVDVEKLDGMSAFVYDVVKPIAREITNFYPREIKTFEAMKFAILSIIKIYLRILSFNHLDSVLEIIKELLQRQNILFVKSFKSGAGASSAGVPASEVDKMIAEQGKTESQQEEKKYKYSRGRLGYTTFHRDCCQIIFSQIISFPVNQFHKMKLSSIKQLMTFMLYFQDFIYEQQMQKFIQQSYQSLRKILIVQKVPKQLIKQSTKELFEQISQKMTKILFYSDKSLKLKILLLGPEFAATLLANAQNIETRLHALRVLQKFANQYYYRGADVLKDDIFAEWLVEKGLWQILIGKNTQLAVVKSCQCILKMILNKKSKLISQQKFKQFLTLIWQTNEDIRKCYLKALDPLKLSYPMLSNIIQNLKIIQQNGQLYNDEFFYLTEQISRYGVDSQRKAAVDILLNVIKKHYLGWKMYSTQRKALDSFKYCFEKLADGIKDTTQRGEMYVNLINEFIQSPNYLTLSISRKLFQSEQKKSSYTLQKAAKNLVQKKHIIETIIQLMSQQVSYSQQLLYFLKAILQKYKSYNCTMSLTLPQAIMIKATNYPQVFTQLINFSNPKDCQSLLQKLLVSAYETEINFESIKQLFYKVNYLFVKTIEPEYFRKKEHRVKINPEQLYFIKDLQLLLVTCMFTGVQQKCAELIAQVYTTFSEGYMEKGKIKMREFMQQVLERIAGINFENQYFDKEENKTQLYGLLCLVKELLEATETQGVGELKAHNALVTTSMLKVKIWNNAAYGDDVQKCFQKSVPSNLTLFQLLTILSDKFKCGQHELYLQQGNNLSLPAKLNGLTLLQLGFSQFRQFSAYKNTKVQVNKQQLKLQNKQLNPLFTKIIKQIFHSYARDNKMGEQQIINYIRGVTNSPSHNRDSRVLALLREYDSDHDGYLSEDDLLRFYSDSCDGGDKEDHVWSNLVNLHYRNDLRKFNQPIGPVQPQNLFRYYLKNSRKTYELLFDICHLKDCKLVSLAKSILGHLPTCQTLVADFQHPLNLQNKSSFQISYILINVRYFLEKENQQPFSQEQPKEMKDPNFCDKIETEQEESQVMEHEQDKKQQVNHKTLSYIQKFINNKSDLIIFALIQSLSTKQQKEPEQQLLIAVSLSILRTLLHLPSLSQDYLRNDKFNFESLQSIVHTRNKLNIQNNTFFIAMISQNMKHANFASLQPALALSLNTKSLTWQQWMYQGIFHQQPQIRKLTLNFLVFYSVENDFSINFFQQQNIKIVRQRCEQWFMLLVFFVHYRKSVSVDVLEKTMKILQVEHEDISSENYYNPILNGNLNLLIRLINLNSTFVFERRELIYKLIKHVIARTLSNQNRFICYQIMIMIKPNELLSFMYNLIRSIKPTDTYQIKQHFVGIKNLGSTCYMNSILQQFFTITKFKKMVLQFPLKQIPAKSIVNNIQVVDDFLYQLQKMYTYLQLSKKKYYQPRQFCLTIKDYNKKPINTSIQEDAHEFLNNLFDKIETYMKQANMLSDLQKVFQGKTICEIACKECNTKKSKIQDFYHLALQVKNVSTLQQSFRKFILPQTIEDYYCQKCEKKSQQITKQTLIHSLPQVLIVNLQRIVFDLQSFMKVKVHSKLEFLSQLNLQQFIHPQSPCINNASYRLKGVVIHSGTSQGGHYYSLIRIKNQWYKFNDQTVSRFNLSDLQRQAYGGNSDGYGEGEFSTNAYILFYERMIQQLQQQMIDNNHCKQKQIMRMQSEAVIDNSNAEDLRTQQQQQQSQPQQQQPLTLRISIFQEQVIQQNKHFYEQLQLHQQSFFNFMIILYQGAKPTQFLNVSSNLPYYPQFKSIAGLENYQLLFNIFMEMFKFMRVFCELPQRIFTQTGKAIYQLLHLLPQETYKLIHCCNYASNSNIGNDNNTNLTNNPYSNSTTIHEWSSTIITHSEITIRELYKVVLTKIIYVYVKYYGWKYHHQITNDHHHEKNGTDQQMMQEVSGVNNHDNDETIDKAQNHGDGNAQTINKIQVQDKKQQKQHQKQKPTQQQDPLTQLLKHFLNSSTLQIVTKNIYKSYYFFEFWSVNIQMDSNLQQFCLSNNYLFILLDILMANESPYSIKDKKRQDLPYEMAPPLLQSVLKLLYRKKNCVNAIPFKQQALNESQYYPLTQQQAKLLTTPAFYKRMIRLKYDNGTLSQIIHFMCFNDKQASANLCQLLLVGLNNIQQIENSLSLLNNIKAFLLINDTLQQERVKWVLGVPQFDHTAKMCYGLRYSNESFNIVYVSSRYFIADEKYKPALQVLHDKRCYFSDFEVNGIITLLQIALNNQSALKHIFSVPPPSYLYKNYFSWILEYSNKLSTEDHYGLTMDKKHLSESLSNLIKQLFTKTQSLTLLQQKAPILQKIIGRNKTLSLQQEIQNQVYYIKKYVHQTYVLQNLPFESQKGNVSLPDEIFSIKEPKSYAVHFIQNHEIKQESNNYVQVQTQKTVITLEIDSKKPLKLTFLLPYFNHQIYINKGQIMINYPYTDFPLKGYMGIEIVEQPIKQAINTIDNSKMSQLKLPSKDENSRMQVQDTYGQSIKPNEKKDYKFDINCQLDTPGYSNDDIIEIQCQICTFYNDAMRTKCEMCGSPI